MLQCNIKIVSPVFLNYINAVTICLLLCFEITVLIALSDSPNKTEKKKSLVPKTVKDHVLAKDQFRSFKQVRIIKEENDDASRLQPSTFFLKPKEIHRLFLI